MGDGWKVVGDGAVYPAAQVVHPRLPPLLQRCLFTYPVSLVLSF